LLGKAIEHLVEKRKDIYAMIAYGFALKMHNRKRGSYGR
jgi:hypothetical protein